jgi:DNA-3-methyladenine glycosylase
VRRDNLNFKRATRLHNRPNWPQDHEMQSVRLRYLRRPELPLDTVQLARYLIGKFIVHETRAGRLSGRIVETEAYPIGDPAAHAFRGQTPRNGSMFLARGHSYVYYIYGSSFMLNVSSERRGVGGGVLLRAIEPRDGIGVMERLRGTTRLIDLARGPGRLAEALGVDRELDGMDLCSPGPLRLAEATQQCGRIGRSVRIGLTRAADRVLRFYERGSPFVSGPKALRG